MKLVAFMSKEMSFGRKSLVAKHCAHCFICHLSMEHTAIRTKSNQIVSFFFHSIPFASTKYQIHFSRTNVSMCVCVERMNVATSTTSKKLTNSHKYFRFGALQPRDTLFSFVIQQFNVHQFWRGERKQKLPIASFCAVSADRHITHTKIHEKEHLS